MFHLSDLDMTGTVKPMKGLITAAVEKRMQEKFDQSTTANIPTKRKLSATANVEVIDLSADDNNDTTAAPMCTTSKRVRTETPPCKVPAIPAKLESPRSPVEDNVTKQQSKKVLESPQIPLESPASTATFNASPTAPDAEASLPTPQSTPPKTSGLQTLPEMHERYLAKTSTARGIEFTNPAKFCLKPAYWRKWTPKQYMLLAEHVRARIDPETLAFETGLCVQEINHVFLAAMIFPLYDVVEASKRGKDCMQKIFELYSEHGTRSREWGKNDGGAKKVKVKGELDGVAAECVRIILDNGSKKALKLSEMSEDDITYLKGTLSKKDQVIVWKSQGEEQ